MYTCDDPCTDLDDLIFETEQLPSKMAPTVSDR